MEGQEQELELDEGGIENRLVKLEAKVSWLCDTMNLMMDIIGTKFEDGDEEQQVDVRHD